jgi:LacI family transcriptional regulator
VSIRLRDKMLRNKVIPIMPSPRRIALMLDLEWPYKRHAALFAGTQQYAQEQEWESIIDEFAHDTLPTRRGQTVPYDGIIARATQPLAERAARLKVPVVNTWLSSPALDRLPGVFPDFAASGRLRAEHLLARGFRRFAALVPRNNRGHEVEMKEFQRVLREAGYRCATAKVALSVSKTLAQWRKTEATITDWMDHWQLPIGVFVGAENVGRKVAQMCHERGWRVPEDVAIIAGYNEEVFCEHPRPSLTSVELGFERIGYEAAGLLHRLMDERESEKSSQKNDRKKKKAADKKRAAPEHIFIPPQGLIVRESTDFFAVDDDVVAAALEFIAAQSHRPITPKDVARAVSMQPRTLQRRFNKVLDRPIATEIRRVRIERAKRELSQTDRSIQQVARAAGFRDAVRMYEVFLREVGVNPKQYRKQRQMESGV